MAKVTKDMIIADIVEINIGCVPILMAEGMHCVGCPAAQGESLEEAANHVIGVAYEFDY